MKTVPGDGYVSWACCTVPGMQYQVYSIQVVTRVTTRQPGDMSLRDASGIIRQQAAPKHGCFQK